MDTQKGRRQNNVEQKSLIVEPSPSTRVATPLAAAAEGGASNGNHILHALEGGSPSVTRGRTCEMSKAEDFGKLSAQLPSIRRPGLINQHSNSLPSTPYRQSRKLSFNSRSPSPEKADRDGSPRSVKSESDSGVLSRGTGSLAAGCRYETGMAFSRRRIPYSVGGDLLERPKSAPKKYLNPVEENKLSGDMRELYDRILPSTESEARRLTFVKKLEKILNERWPGNRIKVHVFGSSGNMLCTSDSDGQYRQRDCTGNQEADGGSGHLHNHPHEKA